MARKPRNTIHEYMLARRIVGLFGKITDGSIHALTHELIKLRMESNEPITLVIDSGGGDTIAALNFCDFLEYILDVPVKAVVTGMCGSAATFILLHCNERLGLPHSRYLIHSSTSSEIALKTNPSSRADREHVNKELDTIHDKVTSMYMRQLNVTSKQVEEWVNRGEQRYNAVMWAEEALEIKLITAIVKDQFNFF